MGLWLRIQHLRACRASSSALALTQPFQLRAAAIQDAHGYTVIPDTRNWIYGDLAEFWLTPRYDCILPPDALNTTASTPFGSNDWTNSSRAVIWRDSRQLKLLDDMVRHATIDTSKTHELQERERLYQLMSDRYVFRITQV